MNFGWERVGVGGYSINQNSQFLSVTVRFTEWGCVFKEKIPPLPPLRMSLLLACAHLHFTLWQERKSSGWQISDTRRSSFHVSKKDKKRKEKPIICQTVCDFNGKKKKKKKLLLPPKNNRQTLFCSALLSSLKCLIHVYTY